jgi:dihydrodipicolinate synthase/N-acetylneuraminate lyase
MTSSTGRKPWHGVLVATPCFWHENGTPDLDKYVAHVAWLAASGCHGVTPNGSLGEYQVLSDGQRREIVRAVMSIARDGFSVIPGVGAYGAPQSLRLTEQAAEDGAQAVLLLPPNSYRATERDVIEHFRIVAKAGLPIVAYNNPTDTRVDLTPELLGKLYAEGLIVAVKEFTGDVRRIYQIAETAPGLDVLVGSDDVVFELALAGSPGWVAGFPSSFPRSCVELFESAKNHDIDRALKLYRLLHPLLRWDSSPRFIQAIKLSMDLVGRPGGTCQPPRGPLAPDEERAVRAATEAALAAGLS